MAQSTSSAAREDFNGTWTVQVTLRNCATNDPVGSITYLLATTAAERGQAARAVSHSRLVNERKNISLGPMRGPGLRAAHPALTSVRYPAEPAWPRFNPALPVSPGFSTGWQTVTHTIELVNADEWRSSGDERVLQRSRAVAHRLLIPLRPNAFSDIELASGGQRRSWLIQVPSGRT